MKELTIEQMESLKGGGMNNPTQCIGGIAATAALGAVAFFAPTVFMSILLTGPGVQAIASVSAAAAYSIHVGC
jgi:hypothetical protein